MQLDDAARLRRPQKDQSEGKSSNPRFVPAKSWAYRQGEASVPPASSLSSVDFPRTCAPAPRRARELPRQQRHPQGRWAQLVVIVSGSSNPAGDPKHRCPTTVRTSFFDQLPRPAPYSRTACLQTDPPAPDPAPDRRPQQHSCPRHPNVIRPPSKKQNPTTPADPFYRCKLKQFPRLHTLSHRGGPSLGTKGKVFCGINNFFLRARALEMHLLWW